MDEKLFLAITQALSFSALRETSYNYFSTMPIHRLSYQHFPPRGATDYHRSITVAALGFPKGWVKRYTENAYYECDPIVRRAAGSTRPFWWQAVAEIETLSRREEDFLEVLKTEGISDGLAVPVFGPHHRSGYFGIGFSAGPDDFTAFDIGKIQWACQLIHLRYCELLQRVLPDPPSLSGQEKSTLKLVAQGYTNTQISNALNISIRTAETYLKRCFDKLDVHDRMTAAFRALAMGLLD